MKVVVVVFLFGFVVCLADAYIERNFYKYVYFTFFFGKFLGYFMNVKLIFQKSFIFLPSHCIIKISIFSFDEYPVLILWYIFRTSGVLKLD